MKQHRCNLEEGAGLCGWKITESTAGITRAGDTPPPALQMDYNPGTENGACLYMHNFKFTFMNLQAPISISTGLIRYLLKQEC